MVERLTNISNCQPLKSGTDLLLEMSVSDFEPNVLIPKMIHKNPTQRPYMKTVVTELQKWLPSSDIHPVQISKTTNALPIIYVPLWLTIILFVVLFLFVVAVCIKISSYN